ncbi:subunit DPH2 of diphthamide synthase [Ordospora colligata]|uniref:Subunit DPH2 of diphthamide synthase n=1 Tax=Ordospora colligata OC4 TaxID=1354746 RepID=A0A0B2UKD3_9MICR|nr:subunit DPH2 of diphthamide synthase [Ordospora colligata OC4]KHN69470.1 subunit DPH2 of diphthamide synthase [Ordospora colligata OC4]TBU15214.1 subunit DPH2 of diphthamide synthase [Ordospora colligata]TBU15285.1 subunit DPH2 of diphthamide synthase [Ordospora colligata]TBU18467.1 subunit DPH2 of diphthamide synthase [Ordospora colligata]
MDFECLDAKLKDRHGLEMGLLSTEEYKEMIKPVYDYIRHNHPYVTVFLLNGDGILCPLKTEKFEMFVLLGVCCTFHPFSDFVSVSQSLSVEEMHALENDNRNKVYDSRYINTINADGKDGMLVISNNQMFFDYYSYRYGAESFHGLEAKDRMQYLSSKCNKGEKILSFGIIAIVFTSSVYQDLARDIRNALASRGKNAYLLFLRDVSYERLISIDGVECIVVVDCPFFEYSGPEIHVPVVTPFEVQYALSGEWKDFDKNLFYYNELVHDSLSTGEGETSSSKALERIDVTGKALLRLKNQDVPFSYEDENDKSVHMGQSGIAGHYNKEGQ